MGNELTDRLCEAAGNGDVQEIRRLAEAGADLDGHNEDGRTALINAVAYDFVEAARLLLALGADPSVADRNGFTPLEVATMNENAGVAQLIRSSGGTGNTDDLARRIREQYESHGVEVETAYPNVESDEELLVVAAGEGDPATVRAVLERGVQVDSAIQTGITALMIAAAKGHTDVMELLLDAGADPNVMDEQYLTALDHARRFEEAEAERLLINRGGHPSTFVIAEEAIETGVLPGAAVDALRTRERSESALTVEHEPPRPAPGRETRIPTVAIVAIAAVVAVALASLLFREQEPKPLEALPAKAPSDEGATAVVVAQLPASVAADPTASGLSLVAGVLEAHDATRLVVQQEEFAIDRDTLFYDVGDGRTATARDASSPEVSVAARVRFYANPERIAREAISIGDTVTVYKAEASNVAFAVRKGGIPLATPLRDDRGNLGVMEVQGRGIVFADDPIVAEILSR